MAKKKAVTKQKTTKPVVKRKAAVAIKVVAAKPQPSASNRKLTLQQQIEALQKQMQNLDQETIAELKAKLADAKKVVSTLEAELATLTGGPADKPKAKRNRRPSITDEALKDQLLKVMANFGKEGMNAKQLAEKLHQDPTRVRKFITDNPKTLKRQGTGPGTKFFLA